MGGLSRVPFRSEEHNTRATGTATGSQPSGVSSLCGLPLLKRANKTLPGGVLILITKSMWEEKGLALSYKLRIPLHLQNSL